MNRKLVIGVAAVVVVLAAVAASAKPDASATVAPSAVTAEATEAPTVAPSAAAASVTELTAAPTVAPMPAKPITVKGSGISNSKPFALSGTYTVEWTATPRSAVGCVHNATLERADGTFMFETLVSEMLDSAKPKTGSTQLYNLDSAQYYVAVISGCAWAFTFSPA